MGKKEIFHTGSHRHSCNIETDCRSDLYIIPDRDNKGHSESRDLDIQIEEVNLQKFTNATHNEAKRRGIKVTLKCTI